MSRVSRLVEYGRRNDNDVARTPCGLLDGWEGIGVNHIAPDIAVKQDPLCCMSHERQWYGAPMDGSFGNRAPTGRFEP